MLLLFSANFNTVKRSAVDEIFVNKTNGIMQDQKVKYGIEGQQAPELSQEILWVNGNGAKIEPIKLADHKGKYKVLYCFQSWCPGCHSRGLPALQQMTEALKENDKVVFFALQTVFEGSNVNTFDKLIETQKKYELEIPFGHDLGSEQTRNVASTMHNYRTGGTPWFIFIDQNDKVVFNDFHLNTEKAIEFLKEVK